MLQIVVLQIVTLSDGPSSVCATSGPKPPRHSSPAIRLRFSFTALISPPIGRRPRFDSTGHLTPIRKDSPLAIDSSANSDLAYADTLWKILTVRDDFAQRFVGQWTYGDDCLQTNVFDAPVAGNSVFIAYPEKAFIAIPLRNGYNQVIWPKGSQSTSHDRRHLEIIPP
jgi:hypothetical protein